MIEYAGSNLYSNEKSGLLFAYGLFKDAVTDSVYTK